MTATPSQLDAALDWLVDCFDDVPDDVTTDEVYQGVRRHYEGGWAQFIADLEV